MYRSRAAPPNLCYRRAVIPAALLLDLVRGLTASTPPPRGLPYLGLEPASGTGFHLLDALSARGIFRKYELVLDKAEHSAFSERGLPGDKDKRNPNHHRALLALSTAFWDAYLKGDARAKQYLQSDALEKSSHGAVKLSRR